MSSVQANHRVLPRHLGRWLVLQQSDPGIAGGRARGHRSPVRAQFVEEDVATVKRTLNRVGSPAILVGHSYGGATITAAGVDERVIGLVYVAAVAPDAGETVQDQLDKYPSDIFSRVEVADGRAWMLQTVPSSSPATFPRKSRSLCGPPIMRPSSICSTNRSSARMISRGSRSRSWYVLATQDHTVHPDLQRWVSKRMGATVTEVASSHVPMLSQPAVVIDVIRKAVAAVSRTADEGRYSPRQDVERLPQGGLSCPCEASRNAGALKDNVTRRVGSQRLSLAAHRDDASPTSSIMIGLSHSLFGVAQPAMSEGVDTTSRKRLKKQRQSLRGHVGEL